MDRSTPQIPRPDARSAQEFVARLADLRHWSGLTFRQLEKRAKAAGELLPHSTISSALARHSLPREDLLAIFVRACGGGPGDVEEWVAVRKPIAAGELLASPPGLLPAEPEDACGDYAIEADSSVPISPLTGKPLNGKPLIPHPEPVNAISDAGLPPVRSYADGELAAAVRAAGRSNNWVGQHRRSPVPVAAEGKPDGIAAQLLPPIVRRQGWATRVMLGVLVLVMAGIAAGVVSRALRDPGQSTAEGPPGSIADDTDGSDESPDPAHIPASPVAVPVVNPSMGGPPASTSQKPGPPGPQPAPTTQAAVAAPTLPGSGPVRIRIPHTGLCLSERPAETSGWLYQGPCTGQIPAMTLEKQGHDTYKILVVHPQAGPGCMGIGGGLTTLFVNVENNGCGEGRGQLFRFEPVTTPLAGFRLRPVHSSHCAGIENNSTASWAAAYQLACDGNGKGQVFVFESR